MFVFIYGSIPDGLLYINKTEIEKMKSKPKATVKKVVKKGKK